MSVNNELDLDAWSDIVNSVDKQHCPVVCIKKIVFKFSNKRQKTINFSRMRAQGLNNTEIETTVAEFIELNKSDIGSMTLKLDIQAIAELVQPATDQLLSKL